MKATGITKTCCPACGSPSEKSTKRIVSVKKDRSSPGFTYVECSFCSTIYNWNAFSAEELSNYHAKFWHSSGFFSYGERSLDRQVGQLRSVMSVVLEKCRITDKGSHLDLGSGEGSLCEAMRQLEFKTIGIEPSAVAVLSAQTRYPSIDFVCGSIESTLSKYGRFNLITLIDVIEHVADPELVLIELTKHLEEDGVLLLRFPISKSLQLEYLAEYANLFMPPFHNTLFSKPGFKAICTKLGLSVVYEFPAINAYGYTKSLAEKLDLLDDYREWRKSDKFKQFDLALDNWFESIAENTGKPTTFFCALKK